MRQQAAQGVGVPLASQRDETRSGGQFAVRSSSFADGQPIPPRHSEYGDGVSASLEWAPVSGARSYVVIVEDPDSKPITPFVHWVAWNMPAATLVVQSMIDEAQRESRNGDKRTGLDA